MTTMNDGNFFRMRGMMSVVVGVFASVLLFVGLYFVAFAGASPSNPLSDVLLLLFVFMIGPAVMMIRRSPFADDKFTLRYIVLNLIEAVFAGFTGFQMLTGVLPEGALLTAVCIVAALYNAVYLVFQIQAFRKLG